MFGLCTKDVRLCIENVGLRSTRSQTFLVVGRVDRQVHVDGMRQNLDAVEVSFQWKNPDFLLRNPDFRLKKVDFTIKQALFEQSHAVSAAVCILWSDKQRMHVFISLSGSVEKASLDMLADEISEHSAEVRIIAII